MNESGVGSAFKDKQSDSPLKIIRKQTMVGDRNEGKNTTHDD